MTLCSADKTVCLMASQSGTSKHRQVHHLSRDAGDPTGWVESITGLTADQPATDLLNNGANASNKPAILVYAASVLACVKRELPHTQRLLSLCPRHMFIH